MTRARPLASGAALIAAALLAACGSSAAPVQTVTRTTAQAPARDTPASLEDLVHQVRGSIVRIETTTCDGDGVGTGFVVGPRLVATVEHVVDGASSIELKQAGRTVGTGVVVGADRDRDVALVRSSRPLRGTPLSLASGRPRLGETVAAIGFPLGLPLSVTRGSVSGDSRTVPIEGVRRRGLIQTDAAVSPGNSGGPLLSLGSGEVIGLVDADAEAFDGIAFAVSSRVAAPLLQAWRAAPQTVADDAGCASDVDPVNEVEAPDDDATSFDGDVFSIAYPADWSVRSSEKPTSFGSDTTIVAPGDDATMLRVDVSDEGSAPAHDAAPVIAAVSRQPGYEELDRSMVELAGHDALHWEFLVEEDGRLLHKEDVFLTDGAGRGVAVLTQAPAADYPALAEGFAAMRGTLGLAAG